jgi:hypothetical protein
MPDPTIISPEPPFNVKFKLLPPDLQVKLWVLGLDANTSKVNIAYSPGSFVTSLAYNYRGNAEACLGIQRFTTTIGVDHWKWGCRPELGLSRVQVRVFCQRDAEIRLR